VKIRRWGSVAGFLALLAGCEHGPPVAVQSAPKPATGSSEFLSQAARDQLAGKVDFDALDRLLSTLPPEDRGHLLGSFADAEAAAARRNGETRDVTVIVRYGDPERQRLLDQVWAPFWSQLPPAVLADVSYPLPGRSLAAVRQMDSAAARAKEREP
jgi:hypothetical protein